MRLVLLTTVVMIAFASNSVLNRLAVGIVGMDPASFALLRVLSGAVMLIALTLLRGHPVPLRAMRRITGAAALSLYLFGFSLAYLTLDAGLGALILFGTVQILMFTISALRGTRPGMAQIAGAVLAFGGLVWMLWPVDGQAAADPVGAGLMIVAGAGWALYTLAGRGEPDPLAVTAANFVWAGPMVALALMVSGSWPETLPGLPGTLLAVIAGAVTSGLGYALWYGVLPHLGPARAAPVQLSVPVIALAAGALLLGETLQWRFVVGAVVVLGGIALSLRQTRAAL